MSKGTGKTASHVGGFGYVRSNLTLRDRAALNLKAFKSYIAGR
jgi:hypothetical protein